MPGTERDPIIRPAVEYGDVTLSIQASRYHYCKMADQFLTDAERNDPIGMASRKGDASTPLEFYDSVEIMMWFHLRPKIRKHIPSIDIPAEGIKPAMHFEGHDYEVHDCITKPSEQLGIDGFDDLWSGDDVAGWVPLKRVGELQVALQIRASRIGATRT